MKKVIKYFINTAMVIILALSFLTFLLPKALGATPLTILTGSMEPSISPGDMIMDKPVKWENIRIGDVITFQEKSNDPKLITHRVIAKNTGVQKMLTTRGDANGASDKPIKYEQVKGRVDVSIPKIGYVTNFFQNHKPILFIIFAILLGLSFIDTNDNEDDNKKNESGVKEKL